MGVMMRGRAGAIVAVAGVAIIVMVIAVLAGPTDGRRSGPPLDPRSTTDSGTRAAIVLVEERGREVSIGAVSRSAEVVHVILEDDLDEDARSDLLEQIAGGGQLVIADARSPILSTPSGTGTVASEDGCALAGLVGVDQFDVGLVPALEPGDVANCYPVRDGWFVTVSDHGAGRIIAVSSARPFTNARLAKAENAALVAGLLEMTTGPVRVVHATPGSGDRSLRDLIGEPVWTALAGALAAVVCHGLFRGRRLGRPVIEQDPVEIDGSELVSATARLYARSGSAAHVVERVVPRLRADLEQRWGFDKHADIETIIGRLQLEPDDAEHVRWALSETAPVTEEEFAARIEHAVHARRIV